MIGGARQVGWAVVGGRVDGGRWSRGVHGWCLLSLVCGGGGDGGCVRGGVDVEGGRDGGAVCCDGDGGGSGAGGDGGRDGSGGEDGLGGSLTPL